MSNSIYLRLAAPLQSWAGDAVSGNIVRTGPRPTFTGLKGLLAGALGDLRGQWPRWLDDVTFAVRQDRAGSIVSDFHTINPRDNEARFRARLLTAMGRSVTNKSLVFSPDAQGKTSIVQRTYLSGAEFIVQVTSLNHFEQLQAALRNPGFCTYLGRKAFAPTFPFYLGVGSDDMLQRIPIMAGSEPGAKDHERRDRRPGIGVRLFQLSKGVEIPLRMEKEILCVAARGEWLDQVANLLTR